MHARRWDTTTPGTASSPLPTTVPSAELRHAYDASDERTLKTAIDSHGNTVYDANIFGSLELRRTTFTGGDYLRNTSTEVAYLSAHGVRLARLHYALDGEPTESGGKLHVRIYPPERTSCRARSALDGGVQLVVGAGLRGCPLTRAPPSTPPA